MKNKFIYLAVLAAGFISCEPEFENEVSDASYTSGDADFSSYVAVGNSLTAGYMDGSVSRVGQSYSFPNTLAGQFAVVGGGMFTQPSFADDVDNLGGLTLGGFPIAGTRLVIDASAGGPENIAGSSTIEVSNLQATPYHNMGVPGAKSFHLLSAGYGNIAGVALGQSNPYFVRHATSATATVLGDAMQMNPTFFTNWIGNNDVLSFATSGGLGVDQLGNLNPATYGSNDITDPQVFASVYSTLVNTLTSGGAKGVVATIPEVTAIPYFTTVPYNAVPLDAATASQLNSGYAAYNAGLRVAYDNSFITREEFASRIINFKAGKNAVVMVDEYLTDLSGLGLPSYRHATYNDLVVLPAMSFIGTLVGGDPLQVNGVSVPLADQWILSKDEKMLVANATAAYNSAIVSIAASKNIAVADMNAIMTKLKGGLTVEDGTIYTANYFSSTTASSVLFSLDGVHPNARGYAVISNEIIKVINSFYNANIPLVSAAGFPGATILPSN
ncbi:G-D-S-L family lipolytic protein [Flavobacterium sp.]|uniref:G-D-S-L family lipolytic protein n=1 Tax=Flavobacterium sp. TaxID=239 RepID=UPI003D2C827B